MPSAFFGLEIAKRALAMSQLNLQVIAHNIANAGTPGYSRQRAELITPPPLAYPSFQRGGYPQQLGSGVDVAAVKRIRDEFLDEIIRYQTGSQGYNTAIDAALIRIEYIISEPGEYTLGTTIDNFFAAWQDLSNNPELVSTRANLREQAISMTRQFAYLDKSLKELRKEQSSQLKIYVEEANNIAGRIAGLNIQITQVINLGNDPNDLMDRRDLLVEELSNIIPITTIEQSDGSMSVLIGGLKMIEMDKLQELKVEFDPYDPEIVTVRFKNGNIPVFDGKGLLAGLIETAQEIIPFFQQRLDSLASAIINRVNVQHLDGFGLDGFKGRAFFNEYKTAEMHGTIALPAGTDEDTTLDALGISAGYFFIEDTQITISSDDIAPGEASTLGDLLDRITAAQPFVRAVLATDVGGNPFIRLDVYNPPESGKMVSLLSGSSNFLSVTGLNNADTTLTKTDNNYTNATEMMGIYLGILEDLDFIAAAGDDGSGVYPGPGNNENSLAIAQLQSLDTALYGTSYTDYYSSTISELGSQAKSAIMLVTNQEILLNQLYVQRESVRGVNMDEEAANMIIYQRIYEGAARVTQVMDGLLDTIINRTGI